MRRLAGLHNVIKFRESIMPRHFSISCRLPVFALAAAAGLMAVPAQAEVYYPWCAQYGSGQFGIASTVCSFTGHQQCMATVRGMGGFCVRNHEPPPVRERGRARYR